MKTKLKDFLLENLEGDKPYSFYKLCDQVCKDSGVEVKNQMITDSEPVSQEEFVENCNYAEELFRYEDYMQDDPSTGFYYSQLMNRECYYMQYVGFEYIFIKNHPTGSEYWLDELDDED